MGKFFFRVVSRLDRRSCGIDARQKKIVVARVKWRNHIQDLMHPPWSFLARGQSMRGARSVDSMHCWFIALWISCIYDHFCQQQCFFLIVVVLLLLGEPVHSMKRAVSNIDDDFFWYSQLFLCCILLYLFYICRVYTYAAATRKSHTGSVTTPPLLLLLLLLLLTALVQKDVILFENIWTFEHIFIADNHVFHDVCTCIHFTLYLPVTLIIIMYIHVYCTGTGTGTGTFKFKFKKKKL